MKETSNPILIHPIRGNFLHFLCRLQKVYWSLLRLISTPWRGRSRKLLNISTTFYCFPTIKPTLRLRSPLLYAFSGTCFAFLFLNWYFYLSLPNSVKTSKCIVIQLQKRSSRPSSFYLGH